MRSLSSLLSASDDDEEEEVVVHRGANTATYSPTQIQGTARASQWRFLLHHSRAEKASPRSA